MRKIVSQAMFGSAVVSCLVFGSLARAQTGEQQQKVSDGSLTSRIAGARTLDERTEVARRFVRERVLDRYSLPGCRRLPFA